MYENSMRKPKVECTPPGSSCNILNLNLHYRSGYITEQHRVVTESITNICIQINHFHWEEGLTKFNTKL